MFKPIRQAVSNVLLTSRRKMANLTSVKAKMFEIAYFDRVILLSTIKIFSIN